jgi:hypothetical protein
VGVCGWVGVGGWVSVIEWVSVGGGAYSFGMISVSSGGPR